MSSSISVAESSFPSRLRSISSAMLDVGEVPAQARFAILGAERALAVNADQRLQLLAVPLRVRDCDEPASAAKYAGDLRQSPLEVGNVVEHPRGDDAVEGLVLERQILHVTDAGVDAASACQLDHALGLVDGNDLRTGRACDPLGCLSAAGADLENTPRRDLGDRLATHVDRVRPRRTRPRTRPDCEARLVRVFVPDGARIVQQAQGAMIGWPGTPRDGDLPFSQVLTVAPTSANSPS